MRTCTRCGNSKPVEDFRRIDANRRHTWCKPCEREASNERAARYRYGGNRLSHDCEVVADNLDHMLTTHPDAFDDMATEVLTEARDELRKIKQGLLAKAGAS